MSYELQENGRAFPPNYLHHSWRDYLYWDTELESGLIGPQYRSPIIFRSRHPQCGSPNKCNGLNFHRMSMHA